MRLVMLAALVASPLAAAPVEQGEPNVPSFRPAFAGQTRAEAVRTRTPLKVTEIATGLNYPWGLAFLPAPSPRAGMRRSTGRRRRTAVAGAP